MSASRFGSNFTIALARGMLLKVIGWSLLARVDAETMLIGCMFFAFLLFASSTKDFADLLGDAMHGCTTLPLRFGASGAILLMASSFVLPWLALPIGAYFGVLSGHAIALACLGLGLACYGVYISRLLWLQRHDLDDSIRAIRHILILKAPHRQLQEEQADASRSTASAARSILRASRRTRSEHDLSLAAAEVALVLDVGPVVTSALKSAGARHMHRRSASTPVRNDVAASSASSGAASDLAMDGTVSHVSFDENHPAWRHMYFLMMFAQLGLVLCYLAPLF
jgi:hypothetical protein